MAHRHFTDSRGDEWLVFDVTPRLEDRRTRDRRSSADSAEAPERRGEDRRLTVGSPPPPRLTKAWLCFERGLERRRLQPIPENWLSLPDAELENLLGLARTAPTRSASTDDAPVRR